MRKETNAKVLNIITKTTLIKNKIGYSIFNLQRIREHDKNTQIDNFYEVQPTVDCKVLNHYPKYLVFNLHQEASTPWQHNYVNPIKYHEYFHHSPN